MNHDISMVDNVSFIRMEIFIFLAIGMYNLEKLTL